MAASTLTKRMMVNSVSATGANNLVSVSLTEIPDDYDPTSGASNPGVPYGTGLTVTMESGTQAKHFFPPAVFELTLAPEGSSS